MPNSDDGEEQSLKVVLSCCTHTKMKLIFSTKER